MKMSYHSLLIVLQLKQKNIVCNNKLQNTIHKNTLN